MILFVEYPKCSTCQKAKKWLVENQVEFEERHIVKTILLRKNSRLGMKKADFL